jgi:hypothetical protein
MSELSKGDSKDYSLRGFTSGFGNRQLEVVINSTTCGILARSWPEMLIIDSILNMSITWICLQDSCFVQSLAPSQRHFFGVYTNYAGSLCGLYFLFSYHAIQDSSVVV